MVESGTILKDQYKIVKEIGSGAFGKVYMVEDIKNNSEKYAIKRLNREDLEKNEYLYKAFWEELKIMEICSCENSVKFIEYFESTNFFNIVMELCEGDLENTLNKHKGLFSEEQVKDILIQLNNVFEIMNLKNIIHRDLKLKNIMIIHDKNNRIIPKLSDFGFSKVMDEDVTRTRLGTPATMAPEIMMNKKYTKTCDLWSIGIITYQLLYKQLPFRARNEKELLNNILSSNGFKVPDGLQMSDLMKDLLTKLLQVDPKNRLTWEEFFSHPFLANKKEELLFTNIDKVYSIT